MTAQGAYACGVLIDKNQVGSCELAWKRGLCECTTPSISEPGALFGQSLLRSGPGAELHAARPGCLRSREAKNRNTWVGGRLGKGAVSLLGGIQDCTGKATR